MTLTSDKGDLLEEGERVRFRCEASANPAQLSYAWYIAGRRVAEAPDASTELVLGKLYLHMFFDHINKRIWLEKKEENIGINLPVYKLLKC